MKAKIEAMIQEVASLLVSEGLEITDNNIQKMMLKRINMIQKASENTQLKQKLFEAVTKWKKMITFLN